MKTNLFARLVSNFLTKHLPNVKGCSGNTIESYEDTFKLMLRFCANKKQVQPESMTIELFHKDLVLVFLQWLEVERNCIISTADDGDNLYSTKKITKINGRLS
jgi:integrase/recombinase XerD